MSLKSFLRGVDLDAIRDATRDAEMRTGGELVCVIIGRCDAYPAASWRGAALGGLTAVTLDALVSVTVGAWAPSAPGWRIAVVLAGLVLGWMVATWVAPLGRLLIDRDLLRQRVARRAAQAFVDEEIFATEDRTGVLLLVAVFERRVEILADRGVAERVDDAEWQRVVNELERALPGADRGTALVQAIEDLGAILVESQVERRRDDRNELRDEPRVEDR